MKHVLIPQRFRLKKYLIIGIDEIPSTSLTSCIEVLQMGSYGSVYQVERDGSIAFVRNDIAYIVSLHEIATALVNKVVE